MLALTAGVLRTNLLAVNALYRQTLFSSLLAYVFFSKSVSNCGEDSRTLSSSLARNSTKAACTSSNGGAGRFEVLDLALGFGVGRDGAADGGAEPGGAPTGGGPGVAIGARFCKVCSGVCNGVA